MRLLAVHGEVTVLHQLPSFGAGRYVAQPVDHVVQAALEEHKQVLTRSALHAGSCVVSRPKLLLKQPIHALDLLLLAKLNAVVRETDAPLAVLSRRICAALDGALLSEAAVALEEELRAFPATKSTNGTRITCHK